MKKKMNIAVLNDQKCGRLCWEVRKNFSVSR
jgi:hypothetical protein